MSEPSPHNLTRRERREMEKYGVKKPDTREACPGFQILTYRDEHGGTEKVWNARIGPAMPAIPTRTTPRRRMDLVEQGTKPNLDYNPAVGDRMIVPLSDERAMVHAAEWVGVYWTQDEPGGSGALMHQFKTQGEAVSMKAAQLVSTPGACDLIEVTAEVLADLHATRARRNAYEAGGMAAPNQGDSSGAAVARAVLKSSEGAENAEIEAE